MISARIWDGKLRKNAIVFEEIKAVWFGRSVGGSSQSGFV